MTSLFYSSPRARFFDSNGQPLALGRISFYFPGTTTFKEIYTDNTTSTPAQNPQPLDAEGYVRDGGVWLGEGLYDVTLERSDGGGGYITEWTIPNVSGAETNTGGNVGDLALVDTIEDLINLEPDAFGATYVFGYYADNDGGQGWFKWDSTSTASADGGAVIAPLGSPATGRWIRQFPEDSVSLEMWGVCSTAPGNVDANLTSAWAYVTSLATKHTHVKLGPGEINLTTGFSFTGSNIKLSIEAGAKFIAAGQTIVISTGEAEVSGMAALIDADTNLTWNPQNDADAYVEWWGADGSDNVTNAIRKASASGRLVFSGIYNIISANPDSAFTVDRAHFLSGSILGWIDGSMSPITFSQATFEKGATSVFQSTETDLAYFDSEIPVKAFALALTDAAAYERVLISATQGETAKGRLLWDQIGVMQLSAQYQTVAYDIESRVASGTLLEIGPINPTYIGTITNGPEQIISHGTTNVPIIINNKQSLQWYGISPLDSAGACANNIIALEKASLGVSNTQNAGYSSEITGHGAAIFIDDNATMSAAPLKVSDVFIRTSLTPIAPALVFAGECYLDNLATDVQVTIQAVENVKITNCDFAYVPGVSPSEPSLSLEDSGSLVMEKITILDSSFNSPLSILANIAGVADNIYITGNTFTGTSAWLTVTGAALGHTNCVVRDNVVPTAYWRGTEKSVQLSASGASASFVEGQIADSDIVFKTNNRPVIAGAFADLGSLPTFVVGSVTAPGMVNPAQIYYLETSGGLYVGFEYGYGSDTLDGQTVSVRLLVKWNTRDVVGTGTFN